MINIDVVIHVEDNYKNTTKLISDIYSQIKVTVNNIVVALSVKNTPEEDEFKKFCKEHNVFAFDIESWYYSSSLTIQRAIKQYCSSGIVVILNENIKLFRNDTLYHLVKDIDTKKYALSFGRQVSKKHGIERYASNELFDTVPYVLNKQNDVLNYKEILFALTNYYAFDREIFLKLGGFHEFNHLLEANTYYLRSLVDNGYSLRYSPESTVDHPYKMKGKMVYDNFFFLDLFLYKHNISLKTSSSVKLEVVILKRLLKHCRIPGLLRLLHFIILRKRAEHKAMRSARI